MRHAYRRTHNHVLSRHVPRVAPRSTAQEPPLPMVNLPADSRTLAEVIVAVIATIFALSWAQRFFIPLVLGIILAYTLNPLVT